MHVSIIGSMETNNSLMEDELFLCVYYFGFDLSTYWSRITEDITFSNYYEMTLYNRNNLFKLSQYPPYGTLVFGMYIEGS